MSRVKLVSALPWRENGRRNPTFNRKQQWGCIKKIRSSRPIANRRNPPSPHGDIGLSRKI